MATTSSNPETNNSQVSDALAISNFNFSDPLMREAAKLRVSAGKDEYEFGKKKAELTEKTMQPLIQEERAGRAKFAERQKEVTDQMTKPFEVPQPMMADFASLGGMLAITASMLGNAGKQPASQAMAAMTGVLDGYQKGRKDLIDRSFKEFDVNMKRLQALQKAIDVELNAYVEGMKLNQQGAQLNLETMIAIAYDGAIAAKLKNASAQDVIQIGMNSRQLAQSAKIASDRLAAEKTRWDAEQTQKQETARLAKEKEERTPAYQKDGKTYNIFGRELTNVPEGAQKFGAPTTKKLDAFSGDASMAVKEYTGATLPVKDAKDVTQIARAMGEAELLQKDVQNNPELIGRTGQVGRAINRYVDSFREGKEIGDDPNLSQEQLIFAKRYAAYLVQYERGIVGNAKGFTVALQQRFNALLNQDQFNPEGFKNLMDQHITELASQGVAFSPKNINRQKLLDFGRDIAYSANYGAPSVTVTQGGAAPASTTPSSGASAAPKPMPSEAKLKAYVAAHPEFNGDINKAKEFLRSQGYQ